MNWAPYRDSTPVVSRFSPLSERLGELWVMWFKMERWGHATGGNMVTQKRKIKNNLFA